MSDLVLDSPVVIAVDPKRIDVRHRLTIRLFYPKGVVLRYRRPVVVNAPPRRRGQVSLP